MRAERIEANSYLKIHITGQLYHLWQHYARFRGIQVLCCDPCKHCEKLSGVANVLIVRSPAMVSTVMEGGITVGFFTASFLNVDLATPSISISQKTLANYSLRIAEESEREISSLGY